MSTEPVVEPGAWVEIPCGQHGSGAATFGVPMASRDVESSQTMTVADGILTVVEVARHYEGARLVDIQTTIIGRYRLEAV